MLFRSRLDAIAITGNSFVIQNDNVHVCVVFDLASMGVRMAANPFDFQELDLRRQGVGMSRAALAKRAGVSEPTVARILNGHDASPKLSNVAAIAEALGLKLCFQSVVDEEALRERQAEEKARTMAKMVQGTMGLEAQALDQPAYERLVNRTKQKLLAGSGLRLWEK